jgi:MFS family permease
MMVVAMLIVSTGMVALGFTATVEVALLAMIAVAIGYSLVNTASSALASMIAPEALQGAALGLVQSVISLGRFIGPMIAGPLYDFQGPAAPFFWGAGLIIVFAAGAALWQPAATHRGHPDNP